MGARQLKFPAPRELLADEIEERRRRNPSYSMRAFARDMDISVSLLSQVLSGNRRLTERTAAKIAEAADWKTQQSTLFLNLVRLELSPSKWHKSQILKDFPALVDVGKDSQVLERDVFQLISKWYHAAILELTRLENPPTSPKEFAARLSISPVEAELAISRLLRLGLLLRESDRYLASADDYYIGDIPSKAIRSFHRQMLKEAESRYEKQSMEERSFSGTVMAVDPKKLHLAKKKIERFRREMKDYLQEGHQSQLYHLSVQLFRLDEKEGIDEPEGPSTA